MPLIENPIKVLREKIRQSVTQDDKFFKRILYYFELRVPQEALSTAGIPGLQTSFLFPLVLNPESISMEEPFTVEETATQGSGLYVEENGIVKRTIRISGNTGFKPRRLKGSGPNVLSFLDTEQKSYGRSLEPFLPDSVSGQRHFQYLQDAVFRTYGDLKRNPATSENTQLLFHNPKDDEHWIVVPRMFSMDRDKSKPIHYSYNIELLAVKAGEDLGADFSEDKTLLDSVKDALRMVKSGADMMAGAVNDLTAMVAELESLVKDVVKILDTATTIINAANNFVEGQVDLIQTPLAAVESLGEIVDASMNLRNTVEQAVEDVTSLPDNVVQKFRQIADGADRISTHPESFETPTAKKVRDSKKRQELLVSLSREARDEALATDPPTTLDAAANLGTGVTSGDVTTAESELGPGRDVKQYTSVRPIAIAQGDTLVNLASRYLGDARLWQHIALANGLKPPFVNELADFPFGDESVLQGSLSIGSTILIPNFGRPLQKQPVIPVVGVRQEASAAEHFLGRDLALEDVGERPGSPLYDWAVDEEGGSVDAKQVSGIDNMGQQLKQRVSIEKGTNQLYMRVGIERIIGMNNVDVDIETARYRIMQAIMADTRVTSVRRIRFDDTQADVLATEMTVQLRGFNQPVTIRVSGL
jgi:hypothetical protein